MSTFDRTATKLTFTRKSDLVRRANKEKLICYVPHQLPNGKWIIKARSNGQGVVAQIWAHCKAEMIDVNVTDIKAFRRAARDVKADLIDRGFNPNTVKSQVSHFVVTRGSKAAWMEYEKAYRDAELESLGFDPQEGTIDEGREYTHTLHDE